MTTKGPAVLLVDDQPDDIELTFEAFRRAGFENPIFTVGTKQDAIDYLRGDREFADRSRFPMPHLILLDHKVPGEEWQILKWVRAQPRLQNIPIAILTRSIDPADQKRAEEMGVNSYHIKPQAFDELCALIKRIAEFWLPVGRRWMSRSGLGDPKH